MVGVPRRGNKRASSSLPRPRDVTRWVSARLASAGNSGIPSRSPVGVATFPVLLFSGARRGLAGRAVDASRARRPGGERANLGTASPSALLGHLRSCLGANGPPTRAAPTKTVVSADSSLPSRLARLVSSVPVGSTGCTVLSAYRAVIQVP